MQDDSLLMDLGVAFDPRLMEEGTEEDVDMPTGFDDEEEEDENPLDIADELGM